MNKPQPPSTSNFIKQIIEADLASGKHKSVVTRFPPEPNGYLHFGHAKSICLNFGLAELYGGRCNLRFDDTNPEKEEQEYVDSILEMVKWLGFDYGTALYASDYFDFMYRCAEHLVETGDAYVDSQTPEQVQHNRGSFTQAGKDSPFRGRTPAQNLALLREMRDGKHADGAHILRARIDMASPNINMRDPTIYRIKRATHHRTGDKWCIYPMYTYAHPIEDAVEGITHSLCTLEFEDQRPFYDWLLNKLAAGGLLKRPLPQQIEFARVNLTHVVLSKRRLIQLVEEGHVDGWDDPRMPTLAGARRRGYTAEGFRRFAERIGVSKANQMIDFAILEDCMREHLNEVAPRRMAVLDPVKLVIENYPDGQEEFVEVPNHPQKPAMGIRKVPFTKELWIEREDFQDPPPKGYFRLYPGNMVRLRYGYVVKCTRYDKATDTVRCTYFADSKSGTTGANNYKVKGNIHWLSSTHAKSAQVNLYDRLLSVPNPAGDDAFLEAINPNSIETYQAYVEPSLSSVLPEEVFQFERYGYFTADRRASTLERAVFNRSVTLRDSWTAEAGMRMKVTEPEELVVEGEPTEEEGLVEYDIQAAPTDYILKTLYDMWKAGDIKIPDFQRNFVWDINQSSLLIESFLVNLPIPQVFFYSDEENRNLVIDGQQRILSIVFYFDGYFGDESTQGKRQIFRLQGLNPRSPYYNKSFKELDEATQRKLYNATLRAISVRQLKPADNTSIYHIFERLNTGGTPLKPQEIRNVVFRGELMSILKRLNTNGYWRRILGRKTLDKHQKDVELLLRIFALSENSDLYEKPMKEYLNITMKRERAGTSSRVQRFVALFPKAAELIVSALGEKPFHVRGPLNSSALDSVFCTVLDNLGALHEDLGERWSSLKRDDTFQSSTSHNTSDVVALRARFARAREFLVVG